MKNPLTMSASDLEVSPSLGYEEFRHSYGADRLLIAQIDKWEADAKRAFDEWNFHKPRRGRRAVAKKRKHAVVVSDREETVDEVFDWMERVLGPLQRGAKQWSKVSLYVDLIHYRLTRCDQYFRFSKGGRLPANKCDNAFIHILDEHDYLLDSDFSHDLSAAAPAELREALGRMLSGQIDRIEKAMRDAPK